MSGSLTIFDPITAQWFARCIGAPTAVQDVAWPAIAAGEHTLVSAPTGTGKTLASFLVFIDRLMGEARIGTLKQELQLIYISPLKSLAGDIRENLRRPLDGITNELREAGVTLPQKPGGFEPALRVAIRTGDTTQSERRQMLKKPPHILITTPESLYLMLTAKSGRAMLKTARWIILDELHAIIDTKRGAHLMLSVARLDTLCPAPLQRIGLSATIEPLHKAAEYLSPDAVTIAAPKMHKSVKLEITSPFAEPHTPKKDPVWQALAAAVYKQCEGTRSVIAFVEGRTYAEKLAHFINQLGGEDFARTHHGSLSKEQRFEVETALRSGTLRLLIATSSMELGIDVGEIDQVFQVGAPRSISSTMQRLGRAGHNPNRTSAMTMFPRVASEALYSGLAAEVVRLGGIEHVRPPRLCLDVLAQHLVSMASDEGYNVADVLPVLKRAYPFREVTLDDIRDVLKMLAGDWEHQKDIPVRPRILYDRIHDRVEGDPYSRMLAVSAGGTIPDRGLYACRSETGVLLGELDEEFVFEARVGDKLLLGSFTWRIREITKDTVVVSQTSPGGFRGPFWKGDIKGRRAMTGASYGAIFRRLGEAHDNDRLFDALRALGLDDKSAEASEDLIKRQIAATGSLPDDRTLLVEHFRDETGNHQMMIHSVFGKPVNEPLAILLTEEAKRLLNTNISFVADDDGLLLFPYNDCEFPQGLLYNIAPEAAKPILSAILPVTTAFNMTFRYNAARALMMGVRKQGRQPLWVQRMRGAEMLDSLVRQENHPLMRETRRECLEDYWDLPGVERLLNAVRAGTIRVREMALEIPSPMSFLLRRQTEAAMMYDYSPTPRGLTAAVEEDLKHASMLAPDPEHLAQSHSRTKAPENEDQLHSLLMIEGDIVADDHIIDAATGGLLSASPPGGAPAAGAPVGEAGVLYSWLEALERREQAKYIEPGLWIAAEQAEEYEAALVHRDAEARQHIVRRLLRYRGAQSPASVAERYLWPEQEASDVLTALRASGDAVEYDGLYYHAKLFDKARMETIKARRRMITTQPPERYAALLASRIQTVGTPAEKLEAAIKALIGLPYPPSVWESVLLPGRVDNYRPELLDTLLGSGKYFWRISPDGLSFHPYDDIDWDAELSGDQLEGTEKRVFDALMKRGATFAQRLVDLTDGDSPYEALLSMAENGLVTADSFVPVRQLLNRDKYEAAPVHRRVKARVMTVTAGRWELTRPLKPLTIEQQLERLFDRFIIVCRETVQGALDWPIALNILRVWEFTGRVRRGYFVEGLSGMQYIRDREFAGIMAALDTPDASNDKLVWLPAVDPSQPWGKSLGHMSERSFLNVPGTAVALVSGLPVAVLERQGKTLRVLDREALPEALRVFVQAFKGRHLYPAINRVTLKDYPPEVADILKSAGFMREMQDLILYR
jgi:ATP-dependent Lhr-like helicase